MLRQSELKRTKPMGRSREPRDKGLAHKVAAELRALRPLVRAKRAGDETTYLSACRGEPCYLQIPHVCNQTVETVVPCHANWAKYGKGFGMKALNRYTVPGCFACHAELDQGRMFTKDEKRAIWESAYQRWEPVRAHKMEVAPCTTTRTT